MQVSPNASRLFRRVAPILLVATAACATATYDTPPDLDSGGQSGSLASAGNSVVESAGSTTVAGSFGVAGSTTNSAGSGGTSTTGGASATGGSSTTGGSPGAAGSAATAGAAMGGSGQAGSTGSAGAATGACSAAAWSATTTYHMGDKAKKGGKEYTAAFYTMADPESHCCGNGQDWASSVSCL